ncbi:hypothetical protein GWI33_002863 [Rhynchophorus ferrugineus]|uniref:Uncharacterized protein n=1 Tax=Rhynchophorus ferrugineus TaxID=354439 RepID=A0A834IP25_RHYFE|nr:hypothetical protein GWI33_002863 [Rhynchophorus ferrugineus]
MGNNIPYYKIIIKSTVHKSVANPRKDPAWRIKNAHTRYSTRSDRRSRLLVWAAASAGGIATSVSEIPSAQSGSVARVPSRMRVKSSLHSRSIITTRLETMHVKSLFWIDFPDSSLPATPVAACFSPITRNIPPMPYHTTS